MALTTVYQLKTFDDIVDAICEEVKIQSTDLISRNRIKRDVNMVYLNEVVPNEQWKWLRGQVNLFLEARLVAGTAAVTADSHVVTLSIAASPSKAGQWFSVDGQTEMFRIRAHTAGATTVYLESPFTGTTNATASYKIWTDSVVLPVDCRETLQITQAFSATPLEPKGLQEFRRYQTSGPKAEGRPKWYTTSDYIDPSPYSDITSFPAAVSRSSSGFLRTLTLASSVVALLRVGDEIRVSGCPINYYNEDGIVQSISTSTVTYLAPVAYEEATVADTAYTVQKKNVEGIGDTRRELWVYPSIYSSRVTLHVDYLKNPSPLIEDSDEPLMPIHDRVVLFYGACYRAWTRERNPEAAKSNYELFENKLKKMAGLFEDSTEYPMLVPSKTMLGVRRRRSGRHPSGNDYFLGQGDGSGGTASSVTGTADRVAVFDGTGALGASTAISTTELALLDGITSDLLTTDNTKTVTNKSIDSDNNTITNIENGDIKTGAAIARDKTAAGTAYRVLANTSAGVMSENAALTATHNVYADANGQLAGEATVAKIRGGAAADMTNVTFPSTGVISTDQSASSIIAQQVFS